MNKILHYLTSVTRPDTALVGMLSKSSYQAHTARCRWHQSANDAASNGTIYRQTLRADCS